MSVPFAFAAIDFETTGSVAGYPVEPWQVGVVVMSPGKETVFWESLLRVGPRPFHPRAPGRHAQLRDQIEAAPNLEECLTDLRKLLQGVPLLAHNAATEKKCLRQSLPMERLGPWIDTLKLSRAAWPQLSSHTLEYVVDALKLHDGMKGKFPDREAHDALYDAYGSALIFQHLLSKSEWSGATLDVLVNPDLTPWQRRKR